MTNTLTFIAIMAVVVMATAGGNFNPENYTPTPGSYLSELQKVQCETGHPACKRNVK